MRKIVLKNGLVLLLEMMPNTHSVVIGLYTRAGVCYEEKCYQGITHLIEHLHFRRCGKLKQKDLYTCMESIGSTLKGVTYRDFFRFSMKIHPQYLYQCINIFKEILQEQSWNERDLISEKEIVLRQIEEEKMYFSFEEFVHHKVCKKSGLDLNIMGTEERVRKISLRETMDYRRKIMNTSNMVLCITGCFSEKDVLNIQKWLENLTLKDGEIQKLEEMPDYFFNRNRNIFIKNIQSSMIEVGLTFDIDYKKISLDILTVLNGILGEGVGSLLQEVIREKNGWTSDIASFIEKYEDIAFLHIRYTISNQWFVQSLQVIVEILKGLKSTVTTDYLKTVLPFYKENMVFYEDDTEETNFLLAWYTFILKKNFNMLQIEENDKTCEMIKEAAKIIFVKENLSLVIVGDSVDFSKKKLNHIFTKL